MRTDRAARRGVGLALALAAIGIVAIGLRVAGLAYGLPAVYNPDEVAIMNRALAFAEGSLNPHNFLYPTLYFYALFAWEGAWFVVGRAIGVFASLPAFERAFFVDPSPIYLAGRALTVVCGVLAVGATYRLAARLFDRVTGVVAAMTLAVAPLAVRDAHYVKHDVPVTLLIVLTVAMTADAAMTSATRNQSRRWLAAGALAGLAMSTHYYAIFVAAPVAFAALMPLTSRLIDVAWSARIRHAGLAAVAAVVAFFAGSPFLLVEPATALRDIAANRAIVVDRATAATGALGSLGFYVHWLATDAMGLLTCLLAIAGVMVVTRAGWRRAVFLFSFPVPFLLFIANTVPASRYLNPVLPFVAVLAGATISFAIRQRGVLRAAALLAVAIAVGEAGVSSMHVDRFFQQTDTRTLALRWIEREISPGTTILVQPYSVPLTSSRAALVEALTMHLGSPARASAKFQRELSLDPYPSPAYRAIYLGDGGLDVDKIYLSPSIFTPDAGLAPLRARAVTYVVLKRYNVEDASTSALRLALRRDARLVASFSPYRPGVTSAVARATAPFIHNTDTRLSPALERPGPIIDIWMLN